MSPANGMDSALIKVLAGAVFISFSSVMAKLTHTEPVAAAFYRVLFAGVALTALALQQKNPVPPGKKGICLAALAGFFWALDLGVWHWSILFIGPGLATLLLNFQVFIMAGFGFFLFKEKLNGIYLGAVFLALAGLYLIVGQNWGQLTTEYRTGVFLALLAALAYSFYLISLRHLVGAAQRLSPLSAMALVSLFCALFLGLGSWGTGETFAIPRAIDWLWLLIYGLVCHSLGWWFISNGLPHIKASLIGLVLLMQPALAFVWDVVFFARPFSPSEATGAGLALVSIYLGINFGKNKT
ncbi:DMT family transporter [Dethiosulfatarculus sandiegensis]|uniref:EamA domain-containing protein n=1 Tax=Dethiosulfatarculus sandiegensis TaxID=1429043 RepID=A0A0D2HQ10_9BACT|nr:DMT family transporter [Dethiosulfatarculus sandiegensis]KIX12558.1 hypothetical protein X474_18310 [Dethiosulfatarculus sandiegensis]